MSMTKKALYALKAKGVDICGDLRIVGEKDLYIGDGSALTSMVKEAEFMELFVDASGEPNFEGGVNVDAELTDEEKEALELVADKPAKRSFLKITRNWGDVVYKRVKGADDLVARDNLDDKVESLPEVKAQLDKLRDAISAVVVSMRIGRENEVRHLDNSFDAFLVELRLNLDQIKTEILRHMTARDVILATAADTKIQKAEECFEARVSRDRFCLSATVSDVIAASSDGNFEIDAYTIEQDSTGSYSTRGQVHLWDVRVLLHKTEESDEHLRSAGIPHTMHANGDKLKIQVSLDQCSDHIIGQDRIVITGVYAGPADQLDAECDSAREAIAPDYSDESHTSKVFALQPNDGSGRGVLETAEGGDNKIQNPA